MQQILLKDLLSAGCHFGHRVNRWNPKAQKFIYTSRDDVHIIDLAKTKEGLEKAIGFLKNLGKNNSSIIFVGTKRQAKSVILDEAKRAGVFYLTQRFPGGLLTNWEQIKKNLEKLLRMREEEKKGDWEKFTKKEQLLLQRELNKLEELYGGIAELKSLPEALFLADIKKEEGALREALKTQVKTVAICDTNTNPDFVDFPIPANDDALGSIKIITSYLAEAYLEGKETGEKNKIKDKEDTEDKRELKSQKAKIKSESKKSKVKNKKAE